MAPDLLIAFNVHPEAYRNNNGYIISEQGKPPDFVMEIPSRSTGREDATRKRDDYAALGIPNTGGSMRLESSTGPGSRETGWRTASMNQSPSRPLGKGSFRAINCS